MSKLLCQCGHLIVDQTDNLPYKADLIPAQHLEYLYEQIPSALAGLVKATGEGQRSEWIRQHFSEDFPLNMPDESLIADFIGRHYLKCARTIYQCEACGRVWMYAGEAGRYVSFLPEDEAGRNALGGHFNAG